MSKFHDLSEKRMANAVKAIQLLGNLSGPMYHYSYMDVLHIYDTIRVELDTAFKRFEAAKPWRTNSWPPVVELGFTTEPGNAAVCDRVSQKTDDDTEDMEYELLLEENEAQRRVINDLQERLDRMLADRAAQKATRG